jgi:putative hydrolase of the HAD superfamily
MRPAVRAVLLDALGTLVELQPPAPRLQRLLREAGFDVSEERAAAGFMAEIAYYLDHHLEGSDRERLERLRDRCAEEMRRALELPDLDHATARRAMLGALEFRPYPDVLPTLGELRERELTLVIASNWDCSLPEWLGPAGIMELVDGVVTSAEVGAPKPNTRVFKVDNDVEGARAAGVLGILLQREGDPPAGVEAISSLRELPALL